MRKAVILLSTVLFVSLFSIPVFEQSAPAQYIQPSAPDAVVEGSAILTDGPIDANWGVATDSYIAYTAWDAQPIDSSVTFNFVNPAGGQGITRTGGNPWFKIPVHLPTGALVTGIEFNYCDTGASAFSAYWFRQVKNAEAATTQLIQSSGTPGCIVQTATFECSIDNNGNSYNIELELDSTNGSVVFLSARLAYRLQVVPAPATATFLDVPTTHPFFQYIEALVRSGITAGCAEGFYCPDAPLTRGQMAVFLGKALGLHWQP